MVRLRHFIGKLTEMKFGWLTSHNKKRGTEKLRHSINNVCLFTQRLSSIPNTNWIHLVWLRFLFPFHSKPSINTIFHLFRYLLTILVLFWNGILVFFVCFVNKRIRFEPKFIDAINTLAANTNGIDFAFVLTSANAVSNISSWA